MNKKHILEDPALTYHALDDSNAFSIIYAIKKGIQYTFFEKLAKLAPFTIRDWSNFLHLSERSMQRYKKEEGTFGTVSSEKIVEITMLYKYGLEVFGEKEKFNAWLNLENVALGGIKPKELLDTSFGIGLLKYQLISIEHGVLA